MMQWIDLLAAPLLALLILTAAGGFFAHEYLRLPLRPVRAVVRPHAAWLLLALVAAVMLASMAWSLSTDPDGASSAWCAQCVNWHAWDRQVQQWMTGHWPAAWMPLVVAFTQLGHLMLMAAIGAAVLLGLLWRRAWLLAGAWALGVAGVGLWVRLIKTTVERARPDASWVLEQGFSFPSGHSAGTLVMYGFLAWMLCQVWRPGHRSAAVPIAVGTVLIVLGVGASRVLLGVHYASDVLAGWLLGLAWGSAVLWALEAACWSAARRRQ